MSYEDQVAQMFKGVLEVLEGLRRRIAALEDRELMGAKPQNEGVAPRILLGTDQPEWQRDCQGNTGLGNDGLRFIGYTSKAHYEGEP